MTMLFSVDHMPIGVEVLAFHRDGKTFHQVKRVDETKVGMRWNKEYSQNINDYHGWIEIPDILTNKAT